MLPSFSLVGSYNRCMYWSSIENLADLEWHEAQLLHMDFCRFSVWLTASSDVHFFYLTDSPSFNCVHWLGFLCTREPECCLWGAAACYIRIFLPVLVIFICIFDRSATNQPSITDHHHDTSLWYWGGRKFDLRCYFCLKDEAICSGLIKVDSVSHYLVAVLWLDLHLWRMVYPS